MKPDHRSGNPVFYLIVGLILLFSCGKEKSETPVSNSPRIRKSIQLISPKPNQIVRLGEAFTIKASHRKSTLIDSIELIMDSGKKVFYADSIIVQPENLRVGIPFMRCVVYSEGLAETVYPRPLILAKEAPQTYRHEIVAEFAHDEKAYTQGLFVMEGMFVESTGQKGSSSIRKVEIKSGKVIKNVNLASTYFGEGATQWNDRIYQLTWTSQTAFVYNLDLEQIATFKYPTEGWGLTTIGDQLVMSDGTEKLYFINPVDFSETDVLQVYDHESAQLNLNELEYFDGHIFANVYGKDLIVKIDPGTGAVVGRISFDGLIDRKKYRGMDYAMNGIAFDENTGKIYVTGKLWPVVFEIKIVQVST